MTITVDSIWIVIGIGVAFGFGCFFGGFWGWVIFKISGKLGEWTVEYIIWPLWSFGSKWLRKASWRK